MWKPACVPMSQPKKQGEDFSIVFWELENSTGLLERASQGLREEVCRLAEKSLRDKELCLVWSDNHLDWATNKIA